MVLKRKPQIFAFNYMEVDEEDQSHGHGLHNDLGPRLTFPEGAFGLVRRKLLLRTTRHSSETKKLSLPVGVELISPVCKQRVHD